MSRGGRDCLTQVSDRSDWANPSKSRFPPPSTTARDGMGQLVEGAPGPAPGPATHPSTDVVIPAMILPTTASLVAGRRRGWAERHRPRPFRAAGNRRSHAHRDPLGKILFYLGSPSARSPRRRPVRRALPPALHHQAAPAALALPDRAPPESSRRSGSCPSTPATA